MSVSWRAGGGWGDWASHTSLASIVSPGTYLRNDQGTFLVLEAMAIRYQNNGGHAGQFLWRRAMQKGIYAQRKVPDQLPSREEAIGRGQWVGCIDYRHG